jgi:hypothetical protein
MEGLPPSHNTSTYTDTSFLHLSVHSTKLRTELCSKINSIKGDPEFSDTLASEEAICKHLRNIPSWSSPQSAQASTLLDLQLRQFLTILHASRAVSTDIPIKSSHRYSMITALEAAAKTLELHHNLLKTSNYALVLTRNDYFRATLVICHIAYHTQRANGKSSTQDLNLPNALTPPARYHPLPPRQNHLRLLHLARPTPAGRTRHAARTRE